MARAEGKALDGVLIDESQPIQRCKACYAPIWFGFTKAGRRNPFDVVDGERTAITHFSTCPRVREFTQK